MSLCNFIERMWYNNTSCRNIWQFYIEKVIIFGTHIMIKRRRGRLNAKTPPSLLIDLISRVGMFSINSCIAISYRESLDKRHGRSRDLRLATVQRDKSQCSRILWKQNKTAEKPLILDRQRKYWIIRYTLQSNSRAETILSATHRSFPNF